jgi:uncharacterized protein YnzC (UPF0291/DUF896 family)
MMIYIILLGLSLTSLYMVKAHTVAYCNEVSTDGLDITVYAGTYHGTAEVPSTPPGSVFLTSPSGDVTEHFFTDYTEDVSTYPTTTCSTDEKCNCDRCDEDENYPTITGDIQYWQTVTFTGLPDGEYTVIASNYTVVETPYCGDTVFEIIGTIYTVAPSDALTNPPATASYNYLNIALYVIIGLIVLGCIAIFICIKCCCCKKKRRKDDNKRSIEGDSNNTKNPNPNPNTSIEITTQQAQIKYVDQNGNPISPPMTQSNSSIKYVDQNGNPVSSPMTQSNYSNNNIKYVDQNGNPVAAQVAPQVAPITNIKYVDQNGNPVAPPVVPQVAPITNIKYVDQNGNPVAPPVQSNIKYVDQNGNPISAPPSNINYT